MIIFMNIFKSAGSRFQKNTDISEILPKNYGPKNVFAKFPNVDELGSI